MRIWAIITVLLTALAPLALAGPEIQVGEKSFDAGPVERGAIIEHTFSITNSGDEVLNISGVRPSCGCTVAKQYDRVIRPGQTGSIPITVDTTKFRGQISKTVTVSTNAENESRTILQVKAKVVVPLEVLPNERVYFNARSGQEVVRSVLLRSQREGLTVSGVSSDNPLVSVRIESADVASGAKLDALASRLKPQAGDHWLRITLSEEAPVGVHNAKVSLETTDAEVGVVEVSVRANVRERQNARAAGAGS